MIRFKSVCAFAALLLCIVGGIGCHQTKDSLAGPPTVAPQTQPRTAEASSSEPTASASKTPLKDAVEKLLAKEAAEEHSVFPKGVRLLSADLQDGVATLDFSKEFNALADMGDTNESDAQKALRRALQSVPGVEKMRVTVQGRPFESQATDWNTPFPVRFTGMDAPTGDH